MDEAPKKIVELLPLPILIGVAVVVSAAWLWKEHQGLASYALVLRSRPFQSLVVIVACSLLAYYAVTRVIYRPLPLVSDGRIGLLIAEFSDGASAQAAQDRSLTQLIIDKLRNAQSDDGVTGSQPQGQLLIVPLGRAIDPIKGREEALRVAREEGAVAIVWGWIAKSDKTARVSIHFDVVREALTRRITTDDVNAPKNPNPLPAFQELRALSNRFVREEFDSFELHDEIADTVDGLAEFVLGFARYLSQDYAGAIESLRAATSVADSRNLGSLGFYSHFFLANSLYVGGPQEQDLAEALLQLAAARNQLPALSTGRSEYAAKILSNEGAIFVSLNLIDAAKEKFTAALSKVPTLIAARANLGITQYRSGEVRQAIPNLVAAVRENPSLLEARYFLALAYYDSDSFVAARDEMRTLLPLLENYVQTLKIMRRGSSKKFGKIPYIRASDFLDIKLLELYFRDGHTSDGIALLKDYAKDNNELARVFSTMSPHDMHYHMDRAYRSTLAISHLQAASGHTQAALASLTPLAQRGLSLPVSASVLAAQQSLHNSQMLSRAWFDYGVANYAAAYCTHEQPQSETVAEFRNKAIDALEKARTDSRYVIAARFRLGMIEFRSKNFPRAAEIFGQLAKEPEAPPAIHYMEGRSRHLLGDNGAAEGAYRASIQVDESFAPANYQLGALLIGRQMFRKAIPYLTQAAQARDSFFTCTGPFEDDWQETGFRGDSSTLLAQAYLALGQPKEALKLLDRPRTLDAPALETLARIQEALKDRDGLLEAYLLLGRRYFHMRAFEAAASTFRKATTFEPKSAQAHNYLASMLLIQGDLDAASAEVARARISSSYYGALVRSADLCIQRDNPAGAIEYLDAARKLKPDSMTARLVRAHANLLLNRRDDALTQFKELATMSYASPTDLSYDESLEEGFDFVGAQTLAQVFLTRIYVDNRDLENAATYLSKLAHQYGASRHWLDNPRISGPTHALFGFAEKSRSETIR